MAIDSRLLESRSVTEINENFDRTLAILAEGLAEVQATVKCVVSFDSAGGSSVADERVQYNTLATAPTPPTKTGYTFDGWFEGESATAFDFATTKITDDVALTAHWTIITLTVTFDSAGGSEVEAQTVDYGGTATEPDDPTKDGNTFAGWYNGASEFNFSTTITEDTTLTAHWTANAS